VIRRVALAGSPWRTFSTRSGFAIYCGSSPTKVGKVRKTLTARRRRVHRGHAAGLTRRVWRNGPLVGRKLCRCISQPRPFGEFGNGRSCFVIGDGLSWLARLGSRMSLRPLLSRSEQAGTGGEDSPAQPTETARSAGTATPPVSAGSVATFVATPPVTASRKSASGMSQSSTCTYTLSVNAGE
jgi:hypothetical protein